MKLFNVLSFLPVGIVATVAAVSASASASASAPSTFEETSSHFYLRGGGSNVYDKAYDASSRHLWFHYSCDGSDIAHDHSTSADTSSTDASTSTDTTSTGSSSSASADASTSSDDCTSIVDTVCAMEDTTLFCDILQNVTINRYLSALDDSSGDDEFTLFVPTDDAFADVANTINKLSDEELGRVIGFHIYEGIKLTSSELECGEKLTSINSYDDTSRTKCKGTTKYQNGNGNTKTGSLPEITSVDNMACNGVIHTLDYVMFPVLLTQLEDGDGNNSVEAPEASLGETWEDDQGFG